MSDAYPPVAAKMAEAPTTWGTSQWSAYSEVDHN